MTEAEHKVKQRVNALIRELVLCDNPERMKQELMDKLDGIDISDKFNLEAQLLFSHLSNVFSIIDSLKDRSIGFVKSGINEYKDQDNPLWVDIVKRNAA